MKTIDLLLHAQWVITVNSDNHVFEQHSVAVDNGIIIDVLPTAEAKQFYQSDNEQTLENQVLMPGLINAHTHAAMNLLRGYADDLPLMTWLNEHIWPAERQWADAQFVHDGTQLAIAEMIRGGTTCFNDMYFFPENAASAAEEAGIRAMVGLIMIDFPSAWAGDPDAYLQKGLALHERCLSLSHIHTGFAPHAPYTVSDTPLLRVQKNAEAHDMHITMHIHETADEVEQYIANHGMRPLEKLRQLGLLTPRMNAVHMTQLTDDEINMLAEHNVNVTHCPESNLKLASGFCPVAKLIDAGINVALGTDGSASNNDLDMFGEMRTAALLAKGVAQNASAVPAATAVRMATINGAKALHLDHITGSLEKGKAADMISISFDSIEMQPMYDPLSHLVYNCDRNHVQNTWVEGKPLMQDRQLTTLDKAALIENAAQWGEKIKQTTSNS